MLIRVAILSDYKSIARLAGELGYPSMPEAIRARLSAIGSDNTQAIFIAESDQEVVGWLHIFTARRLITEPFAEIGGLVVDVNHRTIGIGRALLDQAEQWAYANDLKKIYIRSNTIRIAAHHFYENRGYSLDKTQKVFTKIIAGV